MSCDIANRFAIAGEAVSCERYGQGHINGTFLVKTSEGVDYILQKINRTVFKDVDALMKNIASVTRYLGKRDPEPRHTLHLVPTKAGEDYLIDEQDNAWRMYDFVTGSVCLQAAETPEDFYQSAVAFGTFQRQLAEFPADTLSEVIPHFHDTPDRYRQLREAIEKDACGRRAQVEEEIAFALAREEEAASLMNQLKAGVLPLRVTHNDTKLNNVMLDDKERKPLCVIDLDTVMPNFIFSDYGDFLRTGANVVAEDCPDMQAVQFNVEIFKAFTEGYLSSASSFLTRVEIENLPYAVKLFPYMQCVRFLWDYLSGDKYWKCQYPTHNFVRANNQLHLLLSIEQHEAEMEDFIAQCLKK